MKTTVVTAGEQFSDIDVFSCAIAYSELLNLEGKKSEVVLPGVLNSSITKTIRSWNLQYKTIPTEIDSDVVIVDVSESAYFAKFFKLEQIVEIFDHRSGFQDFWKEKLGNKCHIELVGACATLIWEEYEKRGFENKISTHSANLLSIAIVSNTLSFSAQVTTERDIQVFKELQKYIDLPDDFMEVYFKELEEGIYQNVEEAIRNDTKDFNLPNLGISIIAGQIELWNSSSFIGKYQTEIEKTFESYGNPMWLMSLPSISEKKNYIYTKNNEVKTLFSKIIPITWDGDIGVTDKLWLRKEIRKKLLEL